MITTLLIIILATIFIVAVTIIAAQNTACKDCL